MNKASDLVATIQALPRVPYLLAVSGGPDSMCLAHLFHIAQHDFAIAHVNFGLRGSESDADEALVRTWAESKNIPCFVEKPQTKDFQHENGMSLQEAARFLRYRFFQQLQNTTRFTQLVTAHHANDEAETVLLNLFRGTGFRGLRGITNGEDWALRPLLPFSRKQIIDFIDAEAIPFRTDASNLSNAYTRNALRNQVIPLLREIFPNWDAVMQENILRFQSGYVVYEREIKRWQEVCTAQRGKELYLFIKNFKPEATLSLYLYETLQPFGFSYKQMEHVLDLCRRQSGAYVASATHRVIKHKDRLIVSEINPAQTQWLFLTANESRIILNGACWEVTRQAYSGQAIPASNQEFWFDAAKIQFPLCFRTKQTGDYFYPLGLNKKKKISRFFIDIKLPLHEKEHVWLMLSGERVVWVAGIRSDDRFKVTPQTRELLIFTRINDTTACPQNATKNLKNVTTP